MTGLCIAARWAGDPVRGKPAWRDTGISIEGPAVADLVHAFAHTWAEAGPREPEALPNREDIAPAGDVSLRVIATAPATTGIFRLDSLVAALSRRSLWLTDAYFIGLPTYLQALRAAASDGVDVRLLVPGSSDLGIVKTLGTAGYRPLLEGGIRVFEWNGPMLHAKTAVADGLWARVGSTNLNIASWMGNWELDVAVEDAGFAAEMERAYERDLANATELILGERRRRPRAHDRPLFAGSNRAREGSAVATAGAIRVGNTVSAALGGHRVLRPAEAGLLGRHDLLPVDPGRTLRDRRGVDRDHADRQRREVAPGASSRLSGRRRACRTAGRSALSRQVEHAHCMRATGGHSSITDSILILVLMKRDP